MKSKLKILFAVISVIAYMTPFFITSESYFNEWYASLSTLGIGGYITVDSIFFKKVYKYYTLIAGLFFVWLSFIFAFDTLTNAMFKTHYYILFISLTTLISWLLILFYHKRYTQE